MLLLDTNVVTDIIRPTPTAAVTEWLSAQPRDCVFICAITEAELRYGLAILPDGRRRSVLEADVERMLTRVFSGRILPFDSGAAVEYARILSARRRAGRATAVFDAQIASIASFRGARVATRHVAHFEDFGVQVVDPWAA
jgi:predicted nucleic acid-binding protein